MSQIRHLQNRSGRVFLRSARGFSLLELMLVLAIIGVLIAAAAYNLAGANTKARYKVAKSSMATIKGALTAYYLEQSAYPPTLQTLINGKFLENKKLADPWNREWLYDPRGTSKDMPYILCSAGEDGIPGNEDDIDVWKMDQ